MDCTSSRVGAAGITVARPNEPAAYTYHTKRDTRPAITPELSVLQAVLIAAEVPEYPVFTRQLGFSLLCLRPSAILRFLVPVMVKSLPGRVKSGAIGSRGRKVDSEYYRGELYPHDPLIIAVGDPLNLPEDSLSYAHRIQAEASAEGFDWDHVDGVLAKVEEELGEIREALQRQDVAHARRELGDLMLVTVHLARFLDADSASELTRAARRFQFRYAQLKISLEREGKKLKTCDSAELERHWQRAKPVADKLLTKGLDMHPEDGANSSSVF